jgi:hypothetical protein
MTFDAFTRILPNFTVENAVTYWPYAAAGTVVLGAVAVLARRMLHPAFRARVLAARGATTQTIARRLRMSHDVAALAANRGRATQPIKLLPARASAASYPAPTHGRRAPRMSLSA